MEACTPLLVNDKNDVIADKVLSYFQSLSCKFGLYIARFKTK